jgi:flagellar hook-length control protein FliK
MTMMSSLKAFLFASPAPGAMTGAAVVSAPGGEGGDFAALLGGIASPPAVAAMGSGLSMPVLPVSVDGPVEGDVGAQPLDGQAAPPADPLAMPFGGSAPVERPVMDMRLSAPTLAPATVSISRAQPHAPVGDLADVVADADVAPVETGDDAELPKADVSEGMAVAPMIAEPQIMLVPGIVSPPASPLTMVEQSPDNAPEIAVVVPTPVAPKGGKNISVAVRPSSADGPAPLVSSELTSPVLAGPPREGSDYAAPEDTSLTVPAAPSAHGNASDPKPSGEAVVPVRQPMLSQAPLTPSSPVAPVDMPPVLATVSLPIAPSMVAQPVAPIVLELPSIEPVSAMPGSKLTVDVAVEGETRPSALPVVNAPADPAVSAKVVAPARQPVLSQAPLAPSPPAALVEVSPVLAAAPVSMAPSVAVQAVLRTPLEAPAIALASSTSADALTVGVPVEGEAPSTVIPTSNAPADPSIAIDKVKVSARQSVPLQTQPLPSSPVEVPQAQVVALTPATPSVAAQIVAPVAFKMPVKDVAPSTPDGDPIVDGVAEGEAQPTVMPVGTSPAPVKSEALSLLQLVRDHFVRRDGATEKGLPAAAPRTVDPVAADDAPVASLVTPAPSPVIAPAPAVASASIQAGSASVDLGGTISGQVVDMGVQGQWIDGLAKDIASLSADGAQGKFQIRSDHLGAVQVQIRPGAMGTTVSLTVASEAAQQALKADGDRLIADAALSAMRITDLRVERGTIQEASRSENAGQQQSGSSSNGQSHAQNQAQNGAQTMGQGLSQGMGQNRSGQRDNFSGNHKAGPDAAVLPQADSREGEATAARRTASRARYA